MELQTCTKKGGRELAEHPLFRHILDPLKDGPYLFTVEFRQRIKLPDLNFKGHPRSFKFSAKVHHSTRRPFAILLATTEPSITGLVTSARTNTIRQEETNSLATHPTRLLLQLLNTDNPTNNRQSITFVFLPDFLLLRSRTRSLFLFCNHRRPGRSYITQIQSVCNY